jgi:hypothetical protein
MSADINLAVDSNRIYVVENGFRFEFPLSIGLQLKKYLDSVMKKKNASIGEWILSLPPEDRLAISIKQLE